MARWPAAPACSEILPISIDHFRKLVPYFLTPWIVLAYVYVRQCVIWVLFWNARCFQGLLTPTHSP